jgi:predicted NodU family carbamoyl transferase
MKLKVQAQHLQPGDIVGSGEKIAQVIRASTKFPSSKVMIILSDNGRGMRDIDRVTYWGKYTMINVERPETIEEADDRNIDACYPIAE